MKTTSLPEDLLQVLKELVTGAQLVLDGAFVGAYLQGSFAHGGWDADSDVDFVVVVERDVTDTEANGLQALHSRIFDLPVPWAQHLEGSYFPLHLLRRDDPTRSPLLYIDNTSRILEHSNHDNTLVVRWVLRERGLVLAGPDPAAIVDPIPPQDLCREVRYTMEEWGEEIRTGKYHLDNRWAQPFVMISYCRMLHTLCTGQVNSKPAGVAWAIHSLDARWAAPIRKAWQDRPNPSLKVRLPADLGDMETTLEFIEYSLQLRVHLAFPAGCDS